MTREQIAVISEARAWVDTPYHHQARMRGVGVDCIGLVWGVGEAAGVLDVDPDKVRRFLAYGRVPNPRRFREALDTFFLPVDPDDVRYGDVPWMEFARRVPMHVGIFACYEARATIIHALVEDGRVAEHSFGPSWRNKVHRWYRFPGMNA